MSLFLHEFTVGGALYEEKLGIGITKCASDCAGDCTANVKWFSMLYIDSIYWFSIVWSKVF